MNTPISYIANGAYKMRKASLEMSGYAQSGHPTSCLSAADIVATLFLHTMHFDPDNFDYPNNDRFILSKGHASALLYAAWHVLGKISADELHSYRKFGSRLEGHPTRRFEYTEAATGALGTGLGVAVGEGLHAKRFGYSYYTYVLLGDGELAEGLNWEAAEIASFYELDNVIAIVDCNRLAQSTTSIFAHALKKYHDVFTAFGWHVFEVDGHDISALITTFDNAKKTKGKPIAIIAKTFKGYGIDVAQDKEGFHGKAFVGPQLEKALQELKDRFAADAAYHESYVWKSQLPASIKIPVCDHGSIAKPTYTRDQKIATRQAYGQALAALGSSCTCIVSLDADVKNSTYAEIFEAQFPERFVQCFVAEQNMICMAMGFALRHKHAFASTFSAFMTRAHDHIRMAAIGQIPLRLVGSHAGVSIGEDGPSQMGLEDIGMMRALPDSIVLYPCDAFSTWRLVDQMNQYTKGVSYLRTTRMATPILYDDELEFRIGGSHVLKSGSQLCIVAAGITVFEALDAHHILMSKGISVAVIDVYSIKPIDVETLTSVAKKAGNIIITVEDHYLAGGLGEAVASALSGSGIVIHHLAVTKLPRSGTPQELLVWAGIDSTAIVCQALAILSAT